jgi:hypothetical protein
VIHCGSPSLVFRLGLNESRIAIARPNGATGSTPPLIQERPRFQLPDNVEEEKIEATFKNSVLLVTLPKSAGIFTSMFFSSSPGSSALISYALSVSATSTTSYAASVRRKGMGSNKDLPKRPPVKSSKRRSISRRKRLEWLPLLWK